jgi:hypothetical protein
VSQSADRSRASHPVDLRHAEHGANRQDGLKDLAIITGGDRDRDTFHARHLRGDDRHDDAGRVGVSPAGNVHPHAAQRSHQLSYEIVGVTLYPALFHLSLTGAPETFLHHLEGVDQLRRDQ